MNICISGEELRKALADIERAERNGFNFCLAVFRLATAGYMLSDNTMTYSDMIERAHPTDGNFDWGRHQSVSRYNRFENGRLIPIYQPKRPVKRGFCA